MKLPQKEHFIIPILIALVMILFHVFDFKNVTGDCLGIQPYHLSGLKGILLAPLLHSDYGHLFGNLVPFMALLFLCFEFFGKLTYWVLMICWLGVGVMVWAFPFTISGGYSNTCHIGASGLVYALAFFLAFSGIFKNKNDLLALTLLIVVGYGSMVWGVFPEEWFGVQDSHISWQSHMSGAFIGIILSYSLKGKDKIESKKFDWEGQTELNDKDQALWNQYLKFEEEKKKQEEWEEIKQFYENYFKKKNQNST